MPPDVIPMIHVPDVASTIAWYVSICSSQSGRAKRMARPTGHTPSFGNSELMLSAGGRPSSEHRREVDRYITVDSVDDCYRRIQDKGQIVEDLHDAFYNMREFIDRDISGS
jgi:hypothetical protein